MIKKQTTEKVTLPYLVSGFNKAKFEQAIRAYNKQMGTPRHGDPIEWETEEAGGDFYFWLHCHPIDLLLLGKRLP